MLDETDSAGIALPINPEEPSDIALPLAIAAPATPDSISIPKIRQVQLLNIEQYLSRCLP